MLQTAHQLPSSEAWRALQQSALMSVIASEARAALHGEVTISYEERLDLEEFSLPHIRDSLGITAWSSLVAQALSQYTSSEQPDSFDRTLTSLKHPVAISLSILRERLMDYHGLGFTSPHALARAAASCAEIFYCVDRCDEYWLSQDNRLTFVSRNIHGDMHIAQVALNSERSTRNGEDLLQTDLFIPLRELGERSTLLQKGAQPLSPIATLNQWQDWSPMLGALLVFAHKVGMTGIREIAEYPSVLAELDRSAAATAEADFGTDMMFLPSFVREHSILDLGSTPAEFPNTFCAGPGEDTATYIPVYFDNKIWFPRINHLSKRARTQETAGVPFAERLRRSLVAELQSETSAAEIVRLSPEELPQALRATYRLFCRDPRRVEALLGIFTNPAACERA
jgi:hypothetical protein